MRVQSSGFAWSRSLSGTPEKMLLLINIFSGILISVNWLNFVRGFNHQVGLYPIIIRNSWKGFITYSDRFWVLDKFNLVKLGLGDSVTNLGLAQIITHSSSNDAISFTDRNRDLNKRNLIEHGYGGSVIRLGLELLKRCCY